MRKKRVFPALSELGNRHPNRALAAFIRAQKENVRAAESCGDGIVPHILIRLGVANNDDLTISDGTADIAKRLSIARVHLDAEASQRRNEPPRRRSDFLIGARKPRGFFLRRSDAVRPQYSDDDRRAAVIVVYLM